MCAAHAGHESTVAFPVLRGAVRVTIAYLAMIVIWSTVALAVKWSIDDVGYAFAAAARFGIAALFIALVVFARREPIPMHRQARITYALSAINFAGFIFLFWGAQHVPSGWIGVTFGSSPLLTALMAAAWLGERSLTPVKLVGLGLGVLGMIVIFGTAYDFGFYFVVGLASVVVSVAIGAFTLVWVKRVGAHLPSLPIAAMGIFVVTPLYFAFWWFTDGVWPASGLKLRSILAICYMAIIGTGIVFVLFYYVLKHVAATQIALIGMIAPVISLLLGSMVNDEPFSPRIWTGTGIIVFALLLHEYLPRRIAGPAYLPVEDTPMEDVRA